MVPAPPRVAPAGEPEDVVAGLAAAPHAALHLAALPVCVCSSRRTVNFCTYVRVG
jgi:hypothetical protein